MDYLDHIHQAVGADFPLSAEIPLPEELTTSIDWISEVPTTTATKFRDDQLVLLKKFVRGADGTQGYWETHRPPRVGGSAQQGSVRRDFILT